MIVGISVIEEGDALDVVFHPIDIPEHVNVEEKRILLGHSQHLPATSEVQYPILFTLEEGFRFGENPILWVSPPGTQSPTTFSVASTGNTSQCTLTVSFQAGAARESQQFFFSLEIDDESAGARTFVVDPTIVTGPDNG